MVVVAPGYLNEKSLPYASDIFYHNKLLYFLPTGFHPIELNSVGLFPDFCKSHEVAMPQILAWVYPVGQDEEWGAARNTG
jgi:hypothetical protein